MNAYTILGGDGKEYGPHPLDTIQSWINEGRIARETPMLRAGDPNWRTAGDYTELQFTGPELEATTASAGPPPMPPGRPETAAASFEEAIDPEVLGRIRSGSSWFYWVAALSAINSVAAISGSDWRFILGAGLTEVFNVIGNQIGGAGLIVAIVLNVLFLGSLVLFGWFGGKGYLWAFIVGMLVWAGDSVIFLLVGDWIGVAFHAFVLYCLFAGFQAAREARAAR
jgi:hypothetical protein